jgi:hypothetical protein
MRHAENVATIEGEDSGQRREKHSAAPGGSQLRDDRAAAQQRAHRELAVIQ